MRCLQESGSQSSKSAAVAQQHLPGSGSDDEDAAWEPMHSTAATVDSQSALGQAESVDSELMQVSLYLFQLWIACAWRCAALGLRHVILCWAESTGRGTPCRCWMFCFG